MKKFYLFCLLALFVLSSPVYPQVIQNIINQLNVDSAMLFVKELSGAVPATIGGQPYTILSRHKLYPGNDKAMQYIQEKLNSYGLTTTIQSFSSTGKNVYGVQTGTEFPNQKYIICAHFDAMPNGSLAPGADDNASGTAAVIEAARVLKNYSFPYTIVYALWDEEEQGLIGSDYFAVQASNAGDSILGVINLDMIAWDSNNDNKVRIHTKNLGTSYDLSNKMIELNQAYNIGLTTTIKDPGITASDHASFWDAGYSAILLIEDDLSDFNGYYHTTNDLWTHINVPYFDKCIKASVATLASFALNLNMAIQHSPILSVNTTGNIQLTANVATGLTIGTGNMAPRLYYRVNTGSGYSEFNSVTGVPAAGESGSFVFTIPGQPLGSMVEYYLAAQDDASSIIVTLPKGGGGFNPPGSTPPASFYRFFVAPETYVFSDSTNNMSLWTAAAPWAVTTSTFVSAPHSTTDSPSGNYAANVNTTLTLNSTIDLTGVLGALLTFDTRWDIETDWDYGMVQASTNGGTTWTALQGMYTNPGTGSFQPNGQPLYDGVKTTWVKESIDLAAYSGQQVKLRFLLRADGSIHKDGWYIDNVLITTYTYVPVELAVFNVECEDNGTVRISWITSSEVNSRSFEIERSAGMDSWTTIASIGGAGTTTAMNSYSFIDNSPLSGVSYYRLKQIDYDGTYRIYDPVEADLTKLLTYRLDQNYPNPFNPETTIKYSVPEQTHISLKVYDVAGREIAVLVNETKEAGIYEAKIGAGSGINLPSGVYFYRLLTPQYSSIKKMILLK